MSSIPFSRARHRRAWLRIFFGGLLLWVASVVVTFLTQNANLVPTVILLGSFLVPVTFVAYAFEHRASETLTEHTIFVGVVYGGVLGVLGASVLEAALVGQSLLSYVGVGLIEEGSKLAALWWVARRLPEYLPRDGIVLGAAVGFGFAAFETAGYSFNALFASRAGLSLGSVVETQVLRGILTPVGHGLWTGILGGVLFMGARHGRLRITRGLVLWYLVVSLLHAFWDSSFGIAALVVILTTASNVQLLQVGQEPVLTPVQVHLLTLLSWTFLAVDAAIGLLLLWSRWRVARGASAGT